MQESHGKLRLNMSQIFSSKCICPKRFDQCFHWIFGIYLPRSRSWNFVINGQKSSTSDKLYRNPVIVVYHSS